MSITISRKLVPQRLWCFELFLTFSTVSGSPCSMQLMHLCSEPWYINVRLISGVSDIIAIYPRNIASLITPSMNAMSICELITFLKSPERKYGNAKNSASAMTIDSTTVPPSMAFSCFFSLAALFFFSSAVSSSSFSFFFEAKVPSSSSSSKNDAEYISVLMPR